MMNWGRPPQYVFIRTSETWAENDQSTCYNILWQCGHMHGTQLDENDMQQMGGYHHIYNNEKVQKSDEIWTAVAVLGEWAAL